MTARLLAAVLLAISAVPALGQSVESGRFGRGLKVGQTFAAAEHNPIYAVNPVTVEFWARINGRDLSMLLSNEPRNSKTHWELYAEKETGRFAVAMPGYSAKQVVSQVDIADDQWHYLAYQYDGKVVKLFVDGKEVAKQESRLSAPYYDTGPLLFGYQTGVAPAPDTTIDEVRISRTLRPITAVPDKPFTRDADTVGLWHLDEDEKALAKAGFADDSATANPALLKHFAEGIVNNGGFNNTVGDKTRWSDMDYGPFFSSTISPALDKKNITHKGISIQLGKDRKHFVTFDTELLRMSAAWEGEFLKMFPGREGLGNHPVMGGKPSIFTLSGPGWSRGDGVDTASDPRSGKQGPMPAEWGHYRGLYVNKNHMAQRDWVTFAYTIGKTEIYDSFDAGYVIEKAFHRSLIIGPSTEPLTLLLCEAKVDTSKVGDGYIRFARDDVHVFVVLYGPATNGTLRLNGTRIEVVIPTHKEHVPLNIDFLVGTATDVDRLEKSYGNLFTASRKMDLNGWPAQVRLNGLSKGGPPRYPQPLITKGTLGKSDGPYVVDTITAPDDNPYKSFLRFGGHDFFKNGDAAICSVSGDVWVVSGIDDKLEKLSWRRFATGLFQPLGLKIVDDKVYVLGRDQITRLHDLNNDGEADFYENFNNDGLVTTNGHAYVAALERDPAGNFYYIKCGDRTPQGGTILRVSPDGKKLDVAATGVRNANGLGMGPNGLLSFADNQGDWVPASRIDLVTKPMQFLGYTPMSKTEKPPTDPGKPLVWMPQNIDNSAGGQVWVEGDKWGLPAGTMLHTSYGAATLLQVMPQTLKLPDGTDITQGAVWKFPLTFSTGIMRGRFRPQDGQLYVSGLRGWQTAGTKDGAFQRVRYTGKPMHVPTAVSVHKNGIKLSFSCELDAETANDADSWSILQWNYRWSSEYGSKHWSVKNPEQQGYDTVDVKSAKLLPDGKSVFLAVDGLQPVMQMRISCNVDTKEGETIKTDVHNTIHALGAEGP